MRMTRGLHKPIGQHSDKYTYAVEENRSKRFAMYMTCFILFLSDSIKNAKRISVM